MSLTYTNASNSIFPFLKNDMLEEAAELWRHDVIHKFNGNQHIRPTEEVAKIYVKAVYNLLKSGYEKEALQFSLLVEWGKFEMRTAHGWINPGEELDFVIDNLG
jgi:hypothetical protein